MTKRAVAFVTGLLVAFGMFYTSPGTSTANAADPVSVPKTIPSTSSDWKAGAGSWTLSDNTVVVRAESMAAGAELLVQEANAYLNTDTITGATSGSGIKLVVDEKLNDLGDEGYQLSVTNDGVTITGKTTRGVFWGTRTLSQMLRQQTTLPAGTLTDKPAYQERGVTLCACQINISTDWIDRFLTEMADLKLNSVLMEMKLKSEEYPQANTWSYYTREDVAKFVEKADAYGIDVIPEINSPGHMNIWLENFPQFQLKDKNGVGSTDRLDITNPAAVKFYKDLIDEYDGVFTTDYWHMGADEYMMGASYDSYPQIAEYAKKVTGDSKATGPDAFTYFINDINDYVKAKGKKLRIWNDGIVNTTAVTLDKDIIVEHWQGSGRSAKQLADEGYPIVNASNKLYFSRGYLAYQIQVQGPASLYGSWTPDEFSGSGKIGKHDNILGAKMSIWPDNGAQQTENELEIDIYEAMRYVAQMVWVGDEPADNPNYESFKTQRIDKIGHSPMWNNTDRKPLAQGIYDISAPNGQGLIFDAKAKLGDADQWELIPTADSYYQIKNRAANLCLGVYEGTKHLNTVTQVGASIGAKACADTSKIYTGNQAGNSDWATRNPQKWLITKVGEDTYQIRNAVTLQNLAVATGNENHIDFGENNVNRPKAQDVVQLPHDMTDSVWTIKASVRSFNASAQSDKTTVYNADDGTATISVTVTNEGKDTIENLTVTPEFRQGWTISRLTESDGQDPDIKIAAIAAGESTTVKYKVRPDWAIGSATMVFNVGDGSNSAAARVSLMAACGAQFSPKAVAASTTEPAEPDPNGELAAATDGNTDTYWHSKWQGEVAKYPHWIDVQVAEKPQQISGFTYVGRAGKTPNGRIKDYEIYVSDDGQNWGEPVAKGTFKDSADPQLVSLSATAKFVRLKGLNSQPSAGDTNVMSAAEIYLQSGTCPTPKELIDLPEPVFSETGYTIPQAQGVTYLIDAKPVSAGNYSVVAPAQVVITAQAAEGKYFADSYYDAKGNFKAWTHKFVLTITPQAPIFDDESLTITVPDSNYLDYYIGSTKLEPGILKVDPGYFAAVNAILKSDVVDIDLAQDALSQWEHTFPVQGEPSASKPSVSITAKPDKNTDKNKSNSGAKRPTKLPKTGV